MLRDYEILYIVRPDLDEAQLGAAVQSVNDLIQNLGGSPTKTDVWGRRRLAYEVKHLREGQYVLQLFKIDPKAIPEMEASLNISDPVFRHLIVRRPEEPTPPAEPEAPQPPESDADVDGGPNPEPAAEVAAGTAAEEE
ncbi:MAG: 30S ribosomal protein S6 [Candidatus Dormibacteraceae bacterium]